MNVESYGMNAKYLLKSFKKWSVATHFCVAIYFHQRGHEFPNLHSKIPRVFKDNVFWLHLIQSNDSTKHICFFLSLQATWSTKNKYIITVAFLCATSHVLGLSILVTLLTLNFHVLHLRCEMPAMCTPEQVSHCISTAQRPRSATLLCCTWDLRRVYLHAASLPVCVSLCRSDRNLNSV